MFFPLPSILDPKDTNVLEMWPVKFFACFFQDLKGDAYVVVFIGILICTAKLGSTSNFDLFVKAWYLTNEQLIGKCLSFGFELCFALSMALHVLQDREGFILAPLSNSCDDTVLAAFLGTRIFILLTLFRILAG